MIVSWTDLKSLAKLKGLSIQYNELIGSYNIYILDVNKETSCRLLKNPTDTTDLDDFLEHHRSFCNILSSRSTVLSHETFYKSVDESTEDRSEGFVPANGSHVAISRIRSNGAGPSSYVVISWDRGGEAEKIISSSSGDLNTTFNTSIRENHITGDGIKKFQVCIINNSETSSPIIGGSYEVIEVT